jgi:hypothetical protein
MTKKLLLLLVAGLCATALALPSTTMPQGAAPVPLIRPAAGRPVAPRPFVPPSMAPAPQPKSTAKKSVPPSDAYYVSESFDGATFPPTNWTMDNGSYPWDRATVTQYPYGYNPHSGAGMAEYNIYSYPTGTTCRLITPSFTLSNANAPVNFWYFKSSNSDYGDYFTVQYTTNGGGSWTQIGGVLSPYNGNDVWMNVVDTVPTMSATVKVAFFGYSAYGYSNIYVDDVNIGTPSADDVGCTGIPSPSGDTGVYIPSATIHNYGANNEGSFGAHYYATGPGATYDNTITGLHLASGHDTTVVFPSWHITVRGSWALKCSTQLTGDANTGNDKFATTRIIAPSYYTNVLDSVSGFYSYGPSNYNGYCGGYYFTPQANGQISAIGRYRGSYAGDSSVVSIWLVSSGALLAQATVGETGWGAVPITPLSVTAGTQYCVSTYGGVDWYYGYPPTVPVTQNNVRIDAGWYSYGMGNVMPAQYNGGTFIMGCPDIRFSVVHYAKDVACTGIPSPQGDTGVYIPSATLHNWGDSTATSFGAHFYASGPGATYDQTITGLHLVHGGDTTVVFPSWHITVRGSWAMKCSTQLTGDANTGNDKYSVNRNIQIGTNVLKNMTGGTMYNGNGYGSYSMGYYFTPQYNGQITALGRYRDGYAGDSSTVKLWRAGDGALLATVGCSDTGWGARSITPVNVVGGTQYVVSTTGGNYVSYYAMNHVPDSVNYCRIDYGSYLSGDGMPNNNCGSTIYGAPDIFFLKITRAHDVSCTGIPSPSGDTGVYIPAATIHNYGTNNEGSFGARFYATGPGATYDNTITGLHLTAGNDTTVVFPSWHITVRGSWAIQCSTQLTGDEDHANDKFAVNRSINYAVSSDSLYWHGYNSSYLMYSPKVTSPNPTNRMSMAFTNAQSVTCMTPKGLYVFEVVGTAIRKFSTVDGSYSSYTMGTGSGNGACGSDSMYLYIPNGTAVYKYTLNGSYVNTTTINVSSGQYAFGVANDTVWVGSGFTYYGYACSQFNGGSISYTASWATGIGSGTMMNVAFDGTYYYVGSGGSSGLPFKRYYRDRTVYSTGTCGIDVRSVMAMTLPPVPLVSVVSPNGGESWLVGSAHDVIWNSSFSTKDSVVLMDATDSTNAYLIGVNTPPHDTIAWTVPNHRSTNWKVKVYGFGPNGNGSDMSNAVFSIVAAPDPFNLTSPANHATEVPQAGNLNWEAANGATNYDIYFGTGTPPPLWHSNVGNVTTYAYSGLPKGTHYYWAVVAKNTTGNTRCNTDFDFTTVIGKDVGTVSLTVPAVVDSGATVNPTAVVHNYGTQAENFDVALTFAGLSGYTPVVTVTGLSVGLDTTINFPTTPPLTDRAGYAVSCTTRLTGDQDQSNDRATSQVAVVVRDVGVVTFGVPAAVDSGATVTPTVVVHNYGTAPASFNVNVVIGGAFYNRTQSVTGLSTGTDTTLHFVATGVMRLRAGYAAKCTTQLANDMVQGNDRVAQTIAVNVHDVAAVGIVAPSGQIPPGPITPVATFRNRGTLREPTVLYFLINSSPAYFDSVTFNTTDVVGLPLGVDTTISFPSWTAIPGTYVPRCSVYAPDQVRSNDAFTGASFQCGHVDVAVLSITAPAPGSSIDSSEAITPSVMARNNGELTANIDAWFFIDSVGGSVYNQHVVVTGVAPGASAPISFPEWAKPHSVHSSYAMRCSVYVAFDGDPSNDVATGTFSITARPLIPFGWNLLAPVPPGPKAKNVKDGADLAYGQAATDNDTGYIYAFKGNNRYEFYRYNIDSKEWISRDSIPAVGTSGKKKAVKKGSALTVGTDDKVYGTKGNNTLEFWCYDPSKPATQHWGQLADVPAGAKALKEGTGLAAVNGYIYLLRGSGTTDFYRYNINVPGWETMAPAPVGISGKPYKNGSSIAYDGGDTIWCLKGSYNEFAAYSVTGNIWVTKDTLPKKSPPGTKKTKVKDGSQIASDHSGLVYALKGGNTLEFWTYKCSDHTWYTAASLPAGAKKVKGGGGLTWSSKDHMLYAFRGNNTLEFWVFNPFSMLMAPEHKNDGAMSAGLQNIGDFKLSISPNPFTSLTHVNYTLPKSGSMALRLYDVAGQLVTTLAQGYTLAGSHSALLNADKLAHGIYLLKFESEGYSTTSKLIIE